MSGIVYEFKSAGGIVRVETDASASHGPVAVGRGGEMVNQATKGFSEALSGIRPIAEGIVMQTSTLSSAPTKIEASFGIKLSGELGAILAKTTAEANVQVTLTWSAEKKP
ncbi:CU044_2847 family protein [Gymnodinialimonas sp.]